MTPEILTRWAQTLEDNEHLRTQFAEREDGPGGALYCAFGMLGRLFERDTNGIVFKAHALAPHEAFMIYDDWGFRMWLGRLPIGWHQNNALIGRVVEMNDEGIPWREIAVLIREEAAKGAARG